MEENSKIRRCLFSGEKFIAKRNNQVFANKKNRITYHNDLNNKLRNELKSTNNQLMTNYKICLEILDKSKTRTVHSQFLKGKGFDFRYFTNMVDNKNKTGYTYAIYEFAFEKIDDNNYLIFKP